MAGVAGFEPTMEESKSSALTTRRYPYTDNENILPYIDTIVKIEIKFFLSEGSDLRQRTQSVPWRQASKKAEISPKYRSGATSKLLP